MARRAASSWVEDGFGLPDWPYAPLDYTTPEELLETYARCLRYCRVSDFHCQLFLVRRTNLALLKPRWQPLTLRSVQDLVTAEQAEENEEEVISPDQGVLSYQLLAFAVVLSYSTAEEFYRLASVLLPCMLEKDLIHFTLPSTLTLASEHTSDTHHNSNLTATTWAETELELLHGQVHALHLLLRMTISLVLPRGGELAALYIAAALDLPPELATAEGRRQVAHALDAHRDDLLWPSNFVRVVHVCPSRHSTPRLACPSNLPLCVRVCVRGDGAGHGDAVGEAS
jgi:hypothetical protein